MRTMEAAFVVVHRQGRSGREFLVALRSLERGGYWHLVGGGVEEGETAVEAAVRELEEETGLGQVFVDELPISLRYPDGDEWVVLHVFLAEAPRGWEPVLDEEHVEHRWCSIEQALELLAYEEPREAVRAAAERLSVTA